MPICLDDDGHLIKLFNLSNRGALVIENINRNLAIHLNLKRTLLMSGRFLFDDAQHLKR